MLCTGLIHLAKFRQLYNFQAFGGEIHIRRGFHIACSSFGSSWQEHVCEDLQKMFTGLLIARFTGPTWGPYGADKTPVGPMVTPWTLLSWAPYRYRWSMLSNMFIQLFTMIVVMIGQIKTAQAISFWSHPCCSKAIAGELQVFVATWYPTIDSCWNQFSIDFELWWKDLFVKWAPLPQKWLFWGVKNCLHNAQNRNMHC